jgi:hypothetical protein
MLTESLIHRSRQSWKVVLGFATFSVAFVFMIWGEQFSTKFGFQLEIGGMLACLTALALIAATVRCKECGMRWVWDAVRHQKHSHWVNWLILQRVCPRCGYDPSRLEPSPSEKLGSG